ncbi:hypothetical protein LPJ53_002696 [Coemansia erecta]|uniref:Uncharacterized protein n=1 Tax=Coemansia erecta TaxID=147472 RepID=A0A9W7Y2D3_9FUNG|nr:hypothetical protein LPJ53_002696 [Coemansia erecta]
MVDESTLVSRRHSIAAGDEESYGGSSQDTSLDPIVLTAYDRSSTAIPLPDSAAGRASGHTADSTTVRPSATMPLYSASQTESVESSPGHIKLLLGRAFHRTLHSSDSSDEEYLRDGRWIRVWRWTRRIVMRNLHWLMPFMAITLVSSVLITYLAVTD